MEIARGRSKFFANRLFTPRPNPSLERFELEGNPLVELAADSPVQSQTPHGGEGGGSGGAGLSDAPESSEETLVADEQRPRKLSELIRRLKGFLGERERKGKGKGKGKKKRKKEDRATPFNAIDMGPMTKFRPAEFLRRDKCSRTIVVFE
jgi:hypothetical protein